MPELMTDPVFVRAAQVGLSLILLIGGVQKLFDHVHFESAVAGYALVPDGLVPLVAWLVPILECVFGALLLPDATRVAGAAGAALLIFVLTVPAVVNLLRGRTDIDCGCVSTNARARLSWAVPARNAVLMSCAALGGGVTQIRAMEWLDYASISFAALCMLALYYTVGELVAVQPSISSLRRSSR